MKYKHLTILFCALLLYVQIFAQPRIKDQGVIGSNKNDVFTSLFLTNDGGLIAGGYSSSDIAAQKTEHTRGKYDYWIVKLDSNKIIEWDKTIGGSENDYLYALQQTTDGGYVLGGTSFSTISGDKTANLAGLSDYWVVKLNSSGAIQWDKTFGSTELYKSDNLTVIHQTKDGGYIVGGYSSANKSGDKTEDSRGGNDFWILKLNAAGTIEWDKTIGGLYDDELISLCQTVDGGYIAGGWSDSDKSGEKTQNSKGDYDYWLVKLDVTGTIQWDKTIGGRDQDYFEALQQTTDGGYILGGYSESGRSGDKTQNQKGIYDYWIVKLNTSGDVQWDKTIGGSYSDYLSALEQTTDGGYVLAGFSESNISGNKTENSRGSFDYWVVKTNSQGIVQWDKTIGGDTLDGYYKVRITEKKKNDYAIGGSSFSGISGDKKGGNRGSRTTADYWLLELRYLKPDSTAITSVQNTGRTTESVKNIPIIYPNPANDKLTIQSTGKATFTLSDQRGKILLRKVIENTGTIYLNSVPAGIYLLTNTTTGVTQKIIVTR